MLITAGISARAETAANERGQVELAVAGSTEERAAIQRSLSELLSRLGVELVEQRKPGGDEKPPLASARVELDEVECRITLTAGPGARVVMFRSVARKGSVAVTAETVALILHGAVEELLQSPRRPVVSTAPPEQQVVIAPPSAAQPPFTLDVSAFGGSRAFGGNAPLVAAAGLGVTAGMRVNGWLPELWLSGAYNTPFDASGIVAEIHTQVLSLRGGAALRFLEHDEWFLEGGLGAGADLFFADTRSAFLPPGHFQSTVAAAPIATGLLSAHYVLGSRVDLFVAFTLDVDLQPRRFVEELPDGRHPIYEAARVHPALVLGLDLAAIGARSER